MRQKIIKKLSCILNIFIIASLMNVTYVKADSNTLYNKKEEVPTELGGKRLLRVEEVLDKNDTEELNIVANHPFKYRYNLPHTIWKQLNQRFDPNKPEVVGNFRWNVGVKDGNGNLIPYESVWEKDYKVEMALISKSGTAKFDKGPFLMNGQPIVPYLVNGCIPDASAYFNGSGGVVSAWENQTWYNNRPNGFRSNRFKPPEYVSNSNGVYKGVGDKNNDQPLELYLPNPKNDYTLPACEYEARPSSIMSLTYPKPTPPDSRVHKGIYATTNRVFMYARVKYRGIYEGGSSGSGGGSGEIKFDPNECEWTNQGKTGESSGAFPVRVYYDGENPVTESGSATITTTTTVTDPVTGAVTSSSSSREESFDVNFSLEGISVSGAASGYISGDSGTIDITTEGENLQLYATGSWGSPDYTEPSGGADESVSGVNIPSAPSEPTGTSGYYNIDWTKPTIDIDSANNDWVNHTQDVSIKSTDELSGFEEGTVEITDSSHYGRDESDTFDHAAKEYDKTVTLDEGIYSISVNVTDRAGNDNHELSEYYRIDTTEPDVSFNVKPKIFNQANGAVRKNSVLGQNFAYFGNLNFSDNLSGVSEVEYAWTYGDDESRASYKTIYSSGYTYDDRHDEMFNEEIEKPVGDNLFLHVRATDTAGNSTYKVFGPYEDPIRLKDFNITEIKDPVWDGVNKTYKANELPIDDKSHPVYGNAEVKKGYAFNFNLKSEFLYRDNDRIEIVPNFYYWNGRNRVAVDMYYQLEQNPFVKCGSNEDISTINLDFNNQKFLIGGFSKEILTRGVRSHIGQPWDKWKNKIQYVDGKEQIWYGRYYIPSTAIFVKHGEIPKDENIIRDGNIIINFDIVAYKNGIETFSTDQIFSYIPTQWLIEGGPKNQVYKPGDIILYNNKKNALNDYKVYVN